VLSSEEARVSTAAGAVTTCPAGAPGEGTASGVLVRSTAGQRSGGADAAECDDAPVRNRRVALEAPVGEDVARLVHIESNPGLVIDVRP
jgi:hypothetical protein